MHTYMSEWSAGIFFVLFCRRLSFFGDEHSEPFYETDVTSDCYDVFSAIATNFNEMSARKDSLVQQSKSVYTRVWRQRNAIC